MKNADATAAKAMAAYSMARGRTPAAEAMTKSEAIKAATAHTAYAQRRSQRGTILRAKNASASRLTVRMQSCSGSANPPKGDVLVSRAIHERKQLRPKKDKGSESSMPMPPCWPLCFAVFSKPLPFLAPQLAGRVAGAWRVFLALRSGRGVGRSARRTALPAPSAVPAHSHLRALVRPACLASALPPGTRLTGVLAM